MLQSDPSKIREFLYLDVERVKSAIAQLDQGLAESFTEIVESQKGGEVGGRAGFLGFGSIEATGSYLTTDNRSVSATFHDFAYTYMESKLLSADQVAVVEQDTPWPFVSGQFVLIQGEMSLDDYGYLISMASGMPDILRLMAKIGALEDWLKMTSKQRRDFPRTVATAAEKENSPDWYFDAIAELLRTFYGEHLYITTRVGSRTDKRKVQGPLLREWLRDTPEILRHKYGSRLSGEWCVLGQIASSTFDHGTNVHEVNHNPEVLDDSVDIVLDTLRELRNALEGTTPKVTMTPIAIYRESSSGAD